ncbi:DUF3500 domain-containing protein [Blastococcus sp. SYSU DS0619]
MTSTPPLPASGEQQRPPLFRRIARPLVAGIATLSILGGAVACGTADGATSAGSTASSSSTGTSSTADAVTAAADGSNTAEVVAAAEAFMATLTDDQLATLQYDYSDTEAKSNWSNLPEGMIQRNGVAMGDLTEEQETAALALLEAMLSEDGYQQVLDTMAADDYLAEQSGQSSTNSSGSGPGGGPDWSSDNYFFAFFGTPATDSEFMIQFGGHHLAINANYAGDTVTLTPEFVGIEPQVYEAEDGTSVETLASMKSAVFGVLSSLSADELATAELPQLYDDVVMGAGADGATYPEDGGVLVSDLTQEQQDLVTAAIREWVGDIDEDVAEQIVAEYVAAYDETYLSWAGSTDPESEDAYFRISGPEVWMEYVHQAGIGFSGTHIHTVYRDKTADYGAESAA